MSVYLFSACTVDPDRRVLTLQGQLVDVQPLIFDLLLYMLDNANRVVTKEGMLKAAWRSTVVSDSVVARAVMKLRRAIGDDAQQAKTVQTVHRIGYRFVADVHRGEEQVVLPQAQLPPVATEARSDALPGLAITAFENLSGDPTLDALLPELGHVVRHLVGDQLPLAAVTPSDALQAWQAAVHEPDPLASACERLHVRDLAVLSVLHSAGQYTMRLLRGSGGEHTSSLQFTGPDLLRLAQRMADSIGSASESDEPSAHSKQEFWLSQYSRAVRLHRSGRVEPALELLQLCRAHLTPTLSMRLMQGRLHLAVGELEQARGEFETATRQAQADQVPAMQFEVQMALSELAIAEGSPEAGLQACLRALAVLRTQPELAGEAPKLILRFADMMSADSRGTEAIQLADRAVATAQRLGLRSLELSCRLGLGRTLLRFRQLHRASDVVRRVIDSAQPADDLLKLDGLLMMAEVERSLHRHLNSVELARQARTLARRVHPPHVAQAMTLELEGLLGAGQTDTVAQMLQTRWGFEDGLDPTAPPAVVQAHAVVMWRQGQRERAIATLKGLLEALPESTPPERRATVAAELCFMTASFGASQVALPWREQVQAGGSWLRTRVEAASALCDGRRVDARQALETAWFADGTNPWDSFDTGVDLAWMLVEDDDQDDLERVIAQVLEMPSDHGPVKLLQSAYAMATSTDEQTDSQWRQSVAMYPGLVRRHPALTKGLRAAVLPELLTRACY